MQTPRGRIHVFRVADGRAQHLFSQNNTRMLSWGYIAAKCIGLGDSRFKVAGMYMEFENVASPGDVVTPPSYADTDGIEYYDDLSSSPNRDFLRVPLLSQPSITIAAGYEAYFADGTGNQLSFYAQSAGVTGLHGKPFSDSSNSTLFGAALVAMPDLADRTQDVVLARAYYATDRQRLKEASAQLGVGWDIPFVGE